MNLFSRRLGKVSVLSHEMMEKIHEEAIDLLAKVGIKIEHDEGLRLLDDAGAKVDYQSQMVKIPSTLVEESLKKAPRKIILGARNPEKDLILEKGGRLYARNTGGMDHIYDMDVGESRRANLKDTSNFTRLADALDNINAIAPLYAADTPPEVRELKVLETMYHHTTKHVNIRVLTRENLLHIARMAEIVAGGKEELKKRPLVSVLEAPIQPLRFPDVFVDALLICGEYGIPIEICSMPTVGATGPITLAGSMLLTTVELLASFVVSQVAHPGAPIIWAPRYVAMDMATGSVGPTVETILLCAASAQFATEYYNLVCDTHGPGTGSLVPDGESVFDSTYRAFTTAFAGTNIVTGVGTLELGLVASLEQLVMDNDVIGILHRALAGFEVDDDRLGADAIARVGAGGNFLLDEHTRKYLRGEHYAPVLIKPKTRDNWITDGSKGIVERAKERVREILNEHQPEPLDKEVAADLAKMIESIKH